MNLLTVLCIEHNNTTTTSVGELDLKSRVQAICLGANLIATRLEAIEQLADVVVSLVFFIGKFRIRPNLNKVSFEALSY